MISETSFDLISEAAEANGQSQSDYMRQILEIHVKRVDPRNDRQPAEKNVALTPYERASLVLQHQILPAIQGIFQKDPLTRSGTNVLLQCWNVVRRGNAPNYFLAALKLSMPMTASWSGIFSTC